jgi:hypothetical protein
VSLIGKLPFNFIFKSWEQSKNPHCFYKWLSQHIRRRVLLSIRLFIPHLIDKRVRSCHTNGGDALTHPFYFHSHKERNPSQTCAVTNIIPYGTFSQFPIKQVSTWSLSPSHRYIDSTTLKVRLHTLLRRNLKGHKTIHDILFTWSLALSDWICWHD